MSQETAKNSYLVYSKPNCPQCEVAKALLNQKGIKYEEIKIVDDKTKLGLMSLCETLKAPIPRSVPVVFQLLDGAEYKYIGGVPQLKESLQ